MRVTLFLFLLSLTSGLSAQNELGPVLSYDKYMQIVQENHPIIAAADLQLSYGESLLRMARGGFDPVIFGNLDRKDFDSKRYYNLIDGGLKIPTWLGVTVDAGYSRNDGLFLNPENNTPSQGLVHAGINIPIGQGLFVDERRTQLRKAQVAQNMVSAQRQLLINDLLLEAGSAYWNWFASYQNELVYTEALELAQLRFNGVKQSAILGDRPFIDTLEASIQVQTRQLSLQQWRLEAENSRAMASIYLWLDGYVPMELSQITVPISIDNLNMDDTDTRWISTMDSLVAYHPIIQNARGELASSEIDRQWKAEQLKPTLDLKYKALTESFGGKDIEGFNSEDYTFGLVFKMPIFLRKERGALQLAQLKIKERELKLADKQQLIWVKARNAFNAQTTTRDQANLFEKTVNDYERLLEGERNLFNAGESSLFLVNSREVSYVQARVKLIELMTKNRLSALKTLHSLAVINLDDQE